VCPPTTGAKSASFRSFSSSSQKCHASIMLTVLGGLARRACKTPSGRMLPLTPSHQRLPTRSRSFAPAKAGRSPRRRKGQRRLATARRHLPATFRPPARCNFWRPPSLTGPFASHRANSPPSTDARRGADISTRRKNFSPRTVLWWSATARSSRPTPRFRKSANCARRRPQRATRCLLCGLPPCLRRQQQRSHRRHAAGF
jgi:hypothetical protein